MKFLKTAEKILPLLFWVFIIFAFDTPRFALLTLCAALIHECGHLFFGALRGQLRLLPTAHHTGFRIKPKNLLSYKDEFFLLLGGPVLNFIVFLISISCFGITNGLFFYDFAFLNLLTCFTNLFPIKGYDGYRITETLLLMRKRDSAFLLFLLRALSFVFTVILTFLSLYFLLKFGEGYWIFAIFSYSMLLDIRKLAEDNVF